MRIKGKHYRTVWLNPNENQVVQIIDQRHLPFAFVVEDLKTVDDVATAIVEMHVRGAGCIGATAAYGIYLAACEAARREDSVQYLDSCAQKLRDTRPTAVNLSWAVERQLKAIEKVQTSDKKIAVARKTAEFIADEDADWCREIGRYGLPVIEEIYEKKGKKTVNILTHCNAGWLAFVDYGSATAPIYTAHDSGIPVHVWVDETRPRGQGARLTAYELGQHGVPHTVVTDTASGYLMQKGMVDLVITGSDRTTYTGDVANKIGTYPLALVAKDNGIPFYVALPSSTFDWIIRDGVLEIPIEERNAGEIHNVSGDSGNTIETVRVTPHESPAINYAFDITPSRLVTALITERGVCDANEKGVLTLFPEHRKVGGPESQG